MKQNKRCVQPLIQVIAIQSQRRTWNHETGRDKKSHTKYKIGHTKYNNGRTKYTKGHAKYNRMAPVVGYMVASIRYEHWPKTKSTQGIIDAMNRKKQDCCQYVSTSRQRTQNHVLNNTFHDKTDGSPFSPKGRFLADSTSTSISWTSPI